ncbi:uncharacterized protein LOC115921371 [Strongylocentrotus purpuratus]|uniref:G-protein coupled receptors family 1 profile domain-containing protein n=1 Tax=Strongylocentrotus purpuratus TaxID=7668 RepID=A0A7M7NGF8_STRPU|nr:uncharacterized protein LOC115921371 [Strongylocentrotus purpuratus]
MFTDIYILRLIVGCLAAAFGIPGNITIIVVFGRLGIKNATDITFIALAVVDLIASIINGMKIVMVFFHGEHPWACFIEVIAGRSALYAGLFLTTWIAFYRYQAVCKPFERRIGRRAAVLISVACTVVAFGLHVPFFFITTSIRRRNVYGCNIYGGVPWGRDVYAKAQAVVFCASALGIAGLYLRIYKFIRAHQIIRQQMITGSAAFGGQPSIRALDHVVSSPGSIPSVSVTVSSAVGSLSTSAENVGTKAQPSTVHDDGPNTQETQRSNVRVGTSKQTAQPTNHTLKPSSKKLRNHPTDHKTTQVVIIITVIFFLLWLPNIVLDQIPRDLFTRLIQKTHVTIYFFYQLKYISHITNVFVYLFTYRRFRQSCCKPCNK